MFTLLVTLPFLYESDECIFQYMLYMIYTCSTWYIYNSVPIICQYMGIIDTFFQARIYLLFSYLLKYCDLDPLGPLLVAFHPIIEMLYVHRPQI